MVVLKPALVPGRGDLKPAGEIESALDGFRGSENWHRHWTGRLVYTDGVRYLAEAAEAFWLLDAIAACQPACARDPMLREIQFWRPPADPARPASDEPV